MLLELIRKRVSIRKYSDKKIEKEKLNLILEAGVLAPSSRNSQEFKILVVDSMDLKNRLVKAIANQTFIKEADLLLVMVSTNDRIMSNNQSSGAIDTSISLSFMMLKAEQLGLSTCWLAKYDEDEVKRILKIKKEYRVTAITPLGYRDAKPKFKEKKKIEEMVVYNEME